MLAALSASATAVASATAYAPAFFWAEKFEAGLGHRAEHLGEVSGKDLERTVDALARGHADSLLQRARASGAPEISIVYLLDQLNTEDVRKHGAELAQLQHKMDSSVSSLSVPFTTPSSSFDKAVRVPGHKAEEYLASHPELFDNRVADLVVIDVPAAGKPGPETLRAQDAFVGRISNLVSQATKGNYAALLTGAPAASDARRLEEARRRLSAGGGEP